MSKLVGFGETVEGYGVPVLNEREVRAAAGILFFFALVSFLNSWLMGNFRLTQIFVIAFLIDFTIRIFINPRYSPSMILGRLAVRKQVPEWVGAPQKRFAWAVGWALAVAMFYLIVLNSVVGPINLVVCATCLTLMFFESAFGICLACKIYNAFPPRQAHHCPGGVCAAQAFRKVSLGDTAILVGFLVAIGLVGERWFPAIEAAAAPAMPAPAADGKCTPPAFAVAMGHEEMWKLHNGCK
ncbi:MAG: DUF4395 domain-containing protein [Rhodocyclales bacterium]|nr:DUF4395 domain-containing protein [Rhodocyclales bacterium]